VLKDIVLFVIKWYHVAGLLGMAGYGFRLGWQQLGATEQLAREALKLSPDNPKRAEAASAIEKVQRQAIWQMRGCLLFAAGMIWLMAR